MADNLHDWTMIQSAALDYGEATPRCDKAAYPGTGRGRLVRDEAIVMGPTTAQGQLSSAFYR